MNDRDSDQGLSDRQASFDGHWGGQRNPEPANPDSVRKLLNE